MVTKIIVRRLNGASAQQNNRPTQVGHCWDIHSGEGWDKGILWQ
jgi:hypothetical protein